MNYNNHAAKMRRVWALTALVSVAAAFLMASCTKSPAKTGDAAQAVKIRFAIQPGDIQPYVADSLGYFKEAGLDVELISFSYGPPIIEAFTSANVDFGLVGDLPAFSGIANGVDITIVGVYSTSETQNGLIVRDAANIRRLEDLRGKRISVPFGSNSQPLLYLYLERAGLTEKDVEIVNLPVADAAASLVAGDIDAAVVWEPILSVAAKPGNRITEFATAQGFKLFTNPIIARGAFIKAHPKETAEFLKVLNRAGIWAKANQEEAAKIISDACGIDIDAIKINLIKRGLTPDLSQDRIDALVLSAEQSLKYGLIAEKIDVASRIDTSYLKAAGLQ